MIQSRSPRGVIFDFDGVVVDSLAVHLKAWQIAFSSLYKNELIDTAGLPGRSTLAIAEILSSRVGRPETKIELAELKREVLRQTKSAIKLLPGVELAFSWLTENQVPFGIASNAPRAFIDQTLSQHGLIVEHKFGVDDVQRPKPEPDVFLKCAKALGISVLHHAHILVFEDSPHGITAAVKAGMFPIGVLTQNSSDDMLKVGAKACCSNVGHALELGWFSTLPSVTLET